MNKEELNKLHDKLRNQAWNEIKQNEHSLYRISIGIMYPQDSILISAMACLLLEEVLKERAESEDAEQKARLN